MLRTALLGAPFLLASILLVAQPQGQPANQQDQPKTQSARQALLEVLTGGENEVAKHLTVEVQQSLKTSASQKSGAMAFGTIDGFRNFGLSGPDHKTFDTGPVLIAVDDPKTHERIEVHVDNDDLNGDEDTMQLSLHAFRDGQEIDSALQIISQIEVAMKKQQNLWRVNQITVSAMLPVGDPKMMERLTSSLSGDGMYGFHMTPGGEAVNAERPKPDAERTLQMLALARACTQAPILKQDLRAHSPNWRRKPSRWEWIRRSQLDPSTVTALPFQAVREHLSEVFS